MLQLLWDEKSRSARRLDEGLHSVKKKHSQRYLHTMAQS